MWSLPRTFYGANGLSELDQQSTAQRRLDMKENKTINQAISSITSLYR